MSRDCDFELPEPNLGTYNGQGLKALVVECDTRICARTQIEGNDIVFEHNIKTLGRMIYLYHRLQNIADTKRDGAAKQFALRVEAVIKHDLSGEVDYHFCNNCFYGVHSGVEEFLDKTRIEWHPKVKVDLVNTFQENFAHYARIFEGVAKQYETAWFTESLATQQQCLVDLVQAQIKKMQCATDFFEYLLNFVCNTDTLEKRSYVETNAKRILRRLTDTKKTKVESMEELANEISKRYGAYVEAHSLQLSMLKE